MNLHMCTKFCANRPSRLVAFLAFVLRLVRLFAAVRADSRKTRQKKKHLYIENYNSGPNMQTSTSLTLFTAIFVAFSGALAEELMIFCLHVRTELYRYIYIYIYIYRLQLTHFLLFTGCGGMALCIVFQFIVLHLDIMHLIST